jgi:hypothetical protein
MSSEKHPRHPRRNHLSPQHRFNGNNARPGRAESEPQADDPADAAQQESTEPEGLKLLLRQFQELQEYLSYYAAVRTDNARLSVRKALGRMVPAGLRLVAVGGVIVLASWFVLSGIAQGVGAMFGDRAWIGDLITGAMALVAVGLGVSCAASMRDSASRKRTVEKYESRHAQQRTRFGRDVHD